MTSGAEAAPGTARRRIAVALVRVGTTAVALGFLARHPDLGAALDAVRRVSPLAVVLGLLALSAALAASAGRWRILLAARAEGNLPSVGSLIGLTAASLFFAQMLPGAIGGDVVRAVATRRVGARPADAVLVVAVERAASIAALAMVSVPLLASGTLAIGWSVACVVAVTALGFVPTITGFQGWRIAAAVALSAASQTLTAAAVLCVVADLGQLVAPAAALGSLVVAQLASLVPSVVGLGPGQVATVLLLEPLGVPAAHALAASLAGWALGLVFPVFGALWFTRSGSP